MSNLPTELKYVDSHEWARLEEDGTVVVGITDHAQGLLGDVVFVELPEEGEACSAKEEVAVVESVKAASDVYSPINGTVIAVNEALADAPGMVNSDPYNDGWFIKVQPDSVEELDSLLSADDYKALIEED